MSVNVVFLAGGLGNQLFQIAFAIDRYGIGNFEIDWSQRHPRNIQSWHPSVFEIMPTLQSYKVNRSHNSKTLFLFYRIVFSLFHNRTEGSVLTKYLIDYPLLSLANLYFGTRYRRRVRFIHDSNIKIQNRFENEVCVGYFQTSYYIESIGLMNFPIKLKLSKPFVNQVLERARVAKPIVLHVRLGDYLGNSEIGVLDQDYYEDALNLVLRKKKTPIWVFTDSEEIVHSYIPSSYLNEMEVIRTRELKPYEVLTCMLGGAGYVISNSSLAWWAAYLRNDPNSTVVGPAIWFNLVPFESNLFPSGWIKISNAFK